jgi:formylglycine-generating enzyme required for sulfatase activity
MNRAPRTNLTALCRLIITLLAPVFSPDVGQANSEISFEWVTVGDPGNPNDPLTGIATNGQTPPVRGAVPYVYSISKYETTIGQYAAFLNAVAKSNPQLASSRLWNTWLAEDHTIRGISRFTKGGQDFYHVMRTPEGSVSSDLPITYIGYTNATRFANWLHNGQGNGSTETGAYDVSEEQVTRVSRAEGVVTLTTAKPHRLQAGDWVSVTSNFSLYYGNFIVTARTDRTFSYYSGQADLPEQDSPGSMTGVSARKPGARYWIPSENEWYKAAYYDPTPEGPPDDYWLYPWRSDSAGSGGGNFYVHRFAKTNTINFDPYRSYLFNVTDTGQHGYYGTAGLAGNVEEWTEGDAFSGGPHTRGAHWDWSRTETRWPQQYGFQRSASFYAPPAGVAPPDTPQSHSIGFRMATSANPPAGGLSDGDKIRFHPRAGYANRMVGGVFEVVETPWSNSRVLYTITETPPDGWTEVSVDLRDERFRYRAPDGSHGNVAEIEFWRAGAKVIAAVSGTEGSASGRDDTTFKATFDGDTSTFFDAPQANGVSVEFDTGRLILSYAPTGNDPLTVNNGIATDHGGQSTYWEWGRRILVTANAPPAGQYFAGWDGFTGILDDPSAPQTYATMPGLGVELWLTATFKSPPPGTQRLEVGSGRGSGNYPTGTVVTVSANSPPTGQQFTGWTGDIAILSNPFLVTTTALMPSMSVGIAATYSVNPSDTIRFHPRLYHAARMVGGVFEGTNGDPINGPYEAIYTVSSEPPPGWSEVGVDLKDYRYLRYRGPQNSFGNVAEIEFYRDGTKLTGVSFGTPGSWYDLGNTLDKALDGNIETFFDAPIATGAYAGINTGSAPIYADQIRFYPRLFHAARMVGGVFEGTNGDPINGPYETIYTVSSEPPLNWSEVEVDLKNYRHLRYRGPNNSWGNVAEIEFHRDGVKLEGVPFGTPGSWYDSGNTLEKALDGNVDTFFDAPVASGAFVGIDAGVPDKIRFHPRLYHTARMVGGVFEGTNGDPVNGPYVTIYTVSSEPAPAWNEVVVDLKDYRHLRYRGPANSWGNVAEIEFYRNGTKVSGGAFGTPGSWYDLGNTFDKALDGNLETFFDAPISTGAYVGVSAP